MKPEVLLPSCLSLSRPLGGHGVIPQDTHNALNWAGVVWSLSTLSVWASIKSLIWGGVGSYLNKQLVEDIPWHQTLVNDYLSAAWCHVCRLPCPRWIVSPKGEEPWLQTMVLTKERAAKTTWLPCHHTVFPSLPTWFNWCLFHRTFRHYFNEVKHLKSLSIIFLKMLST